MIFWTSEEKEAQDICLVLANLELEEIFPESPLEVVRVSLVPRSCLVSRLELKEPIAVLTFSVAELKVELFQVLIVLIF